MKILGFNSAGRRCGETHHRAKLTDAELELIFYLRFEAKLSYAAIAAKWDDGKTISKSTVRDVCTGRRRAQLVTYWRPAKR